MKPFTIALAAFLFTATGFAEQTSPQALFEAGEYDKVLAALESELSSPAADPLNHYLAVQAYLRLEQPGGAARDLAALAASADPGWRLVGQSAQALNDGDAGRAVERATEAASANPGLFATHYQLGLAKARAEDWAAAAAAFEHAAEINPSFAYAFYYAGLSYSRVRRADKTAEHFERFLRAAPNAPERGNVQSIMRTMRGR